MSDSVVADVDTTIIDALPNNDSGSSIESLGGVDHSVIPVDTLTNKVVDETEVSVSIAPEPKLEETGTNQPQVVKAEVQEAATEAATEVKTEEIQVENVKAEEPVAEDKNDVKVDEPLESAKADIKEEPKVEVVEESKVEVVKAVEEPKTEEPKKEEPKTEEPKTEEFKTEEPKVEESKVEESKVVAMEESKKEESKKEEPKEEPKKEEPKPEEPKKEEPKAEEPIKEEPKKEEPKKWSSTFATSNPLTISSSPSSSPTATTGVKASPFVSLSPSVATTQARSAFSTQAKQPISLANSTTTSPSGTTSSSAAAAGLASTNSNVSSYFASRANAWDASATLPKSYNTTSPSSTERLSVSAMAQQRDRQASAYTPPSTFSYSETRTASRSVYHNPSAGHTQGSMASFLGGSLGVRHEGRSTGLLKPRTDKEEEAARVWHSNRAANSQMSGVFKSVVADTLKKDDGSVDNAAQRYLHRRLTESK